MKLFIELLGIVVAVVGMAMLVISDDDDMKVLAICLGMLAVPLIMLPLKTSEQLFMQVFAGVIVFMAIVLWIVSDDDIMHKLAISMVAVAVLIIILPIIFRNIADWIFIFLSK